MLHKVTSELLNSCHTIRENYLTTSHNIYTKNGSIQNSQLSTQRNGPVSHRRAARAAEEPFSSAADASKESREPNRKERLVESGVERSIAAGRIFNNEYLLVKFSGDTAENGSRELCNRSRLVVALDAHSLLSLRRCCGWTSRGRARATASSSWPSAQPRGKQQK